MNIAIIANRLKTYRSRTKQEEKNALREIAQEIALSALARTDFFKHAAFIGGSCLRIVHGLERFSEDLDFWTLRPTSNFQWKPYLQVIADEFSAYAFHMHVEDRDHPNVRIKRAFLKQDSIGKVFVLSYARDFSDKEKLQIKFEIDTHPPMGAEFESKNINFPYSCSITTLDEPSLFASKIGALFDIKLEKGRHWHDFIWYITRQWPINYPLLTHILSSPHSLSLSSVKQALVDLVQSKSDKDWKALREDVRNFLPSEEHAILNAWGKEFFLSHIENLEAVLSSR